MTRPGLGSQDSDPEGGRLPSEGHQGRSPGRCPGSGALGAAFCARGSSSFHERLEIAPAGGQCLWLNVNLEREQEEKEKQGDGMINTCPPEEPLDGSPAGPPGGRFYLNKC